jgi:hypothetical protein
MLRAVISRTD